MNLKRLIQLILLVWFVAISVAILVPSYQLLFAREAASPTSTQALPAPPDAPPTPEPLGRNDTRPDPARQTQQAADYKQQIDIYIQRVNAYAQQVAAYKEHLTALKAQREAKDRTNRLAVYETVVRNSLVTLVSGFATALIAFVFANLSTQVVDNYVKVKNGRDPAPLHWF